MAELQVTFRSILAGPKSQEIDQFQLGVGRSQFVAADKAIDAVLVLEARAKTLRRNSSPPPGTLGRYFPGPTAVRNG